MYYTLYNYWTILSSFVLIFILTTSSYGYLVLDVAEMSAENQAAAITNIQPRVIGADGSESTQGGVFRQTVYDKAYMDEVGETVVEAKLQELKSTLTQWREKAVSFMMDNENLVEINNELYSTLRRNINLIKDINDLIIQEGILDLDTFLVTEFVEADGSRKILTIMRTKTHPNNIKYLGGAVSDSENLIKTNLRQAGGIKAAGVFNRNNMLKYFIEQKGTTTFVSDSMTQKLQVNLYKLGFVENATYCLPEVP